MTRTESYQRTLQGTLASTTKWIVGREFNPSKQCRYYGRLSLWFLVSRKRASGPEFIWSSLFRPIQYPCVFGYLHCYKPWLGCSIECGKIVTLGKSLHGYAPMKLQFFEGMWLFVFPFFRCWNSFFRFIFRMTKKSGRRENKRKKVKNFSGSNHPGNLDICDLKEGNVKKIFIFDHTGTGKLTSRYNQAHQNTRACDSRDPRHLQVHHQKADTVPSPAAASDRVSAMSRTHSAR